MREIKFRAWNNQRKKMVYPGDIVEEDELMFNLAGVSIEYRNNHACGDPECCGRNENYYVDCADDYVLMQYTGLKDKDGKEIYEGDIVITQDVLATVEWCDNPQHLAWTVQYGGRELEYWWPDCEVIGNIYENPDLLETKIED